MKRLVFLMSVLILGSAVGVAARKQKASNNIVQTIAASADHKSLSEALKTANLQETLSLPGPYTVFAPVNAAFEKLPPEMVNSADKPEPKARLIKILNYHILYGRYDSGKLRKLIRNSGSRGLLKTVDGAEITAQYDGEHFILTDVKGNKATVTTADVDASNGVIYVINKVLMP